MNVASPILRIALFRPLRHPLDYRPPDEGLRPPIGARVLVPLGGHQALGVVHEYTERSTIDPDRLRSVAQVLDADALPSADAIELAQWAARYYHYPPGQVWATLFPPSLRRADGRLPSPEPHWRRRPTTDAPPEPLPPQARLQRRLLDRIEAAGPAGVPEGELRPIGGAWREALRALQRRGWVIAGEGPAQPTPVEGRPGPTLNAEQDAAVQALRARLGRFAPTLLEGVTGSGKTEVYLQVIAETVAQGRQALILVPEIGLTPQLIQRFRERLGARVHPYHSGLAEGERLRTWREARAGRASVILATRSGIFASLPQLGVIVIDEEHDLSFKQHEGFPYHARDLAVVRAARQGIPVILGSATPSLETLHHGETGRYGHLRLRQRAGGAQPPTWELVDIRGQRRYSGIARNVLPRIEGQLAAGNQVLVFLNRRGYAPVFLCDDCGWCADCPRCDAHLTYHAQASRLRCHHCGHHQPPPRYCPACGSTRLVALGEGTEQLEQELAQRFPAATLARIDADTTRSRTRRDTLLADAAAGRADLLIGTQMVAKGHHFPGVTLAVILNVDQGLYGADLRASEHLAQLLVQVAGRAGRAERPGHVLLQTRAPNHRLLQRLINGGYPEASQTLLAERAAHRLAPFRALALLRAEASSRQHALGFLEAARHCPSLARTHQLEVLGPAPAPMERRQGRYRQHLLLQADRRSELQAVFPGWLAELEALDGAERVRWTLDVDPAQLV